MQSKLFVITLVLCAVIIEIHSEYRMPEYTRIKRAKYYSSPPKFYRRPPPIYPVRGAFSYTPPPGYMMDDEEPAPPSLRPSKVSKRPTNDGLGEDDLNNFVKYLSKDDLDKIIEFAGAKSEKPIDNNVSRYGEKNYRDADSDDTKFSILGPYNSRQEPTISSNAQETQPRIVNNSPNTHYNHAAFSNTPKQQTDESVAFFNEYIQNDLSQVASYANTQVSDNKITREEDLPKPANLREEDFDISYTNNVPTVVKAESYKVENGHGHLPLMNFHDSKLHSGSSYTVPHYTITTYNRQQSTSSSSSSSKKPIVYEAAPPASAAKEQSDAHLKAIKIWTHQSKGTAYTLHNDGTLSLEKPGRPKPSYGYA